jgi:hypothetical protein
MNGVILRLLLTFWRPIAALLAGFGLYAKGRADATAKAEAKASKAALQTIERINDAKDKAAAGGAGDDWHRRLRDAE